MDEPFLEHPSGEFETAADAMADAIVRLRSLPAWSRWITFCAQGMGSRPDTYHMAEIRVRQNLLDVDEPIDMNLVIRLANVPPSCLTKVDDFYSVVEASPEQAAQILDAIFRHCLQIRPHDGEGDDYAIGAEW